MKALWQAYYNMNVSELAPLATTAWNEYRKANPKAQWLAWLAEWVKARLASESDKVKAKVETYRKKCKALDFVGEDPDTRLRRFTQYVITLWGVIVLTFLKGYLSAPCNAGCIRKGTQRQYGLEYHVGSWRSEPIVQWLSTSMLVSVV